MDDGEFVEVGDYAGIAKTIFLLAGVVVGGLLLAVLTMFGVFDDVDDKVSYIGYRKRKLARLNAP